MLTYRNTEGECKLYSNLANGEGVLVWHPTDAKMFRRNWVDPPSMSTLKGWRGTGTERSLATAAEVGERHTIRRWNAGAPPNGRHMMHMTALLEMADTLRLGHLLTARDGWQEARCGTPDSTGNNGAPETVCRGGRQPPSLVSRRHSTVSPQVRSALAPDGTCGSGRSHWAAHLAVAPALKRRAAARRKWLSNSLPAALHPTCLRQTVAPCAPGAALAPRCEPHYELRDPGNGEDFDS